MATLLAGCGGGGGSKKVPDDVAVKNQVSAYLAAFYRGDGETACSLLTLGGQAGMKAESTGTQVPDCAGAVAELSKTSRPLKSPRINVRVSRDRATVTISSKKPAYESGALLQKREGKWLIAYPPGLLQKYTGPGGVKPNASPTTPSE